MEKILDKERKEKEMPKKIFEKYQKQSKKKLAVQKIIIELERVNTE